MTSAPPSRTSYAPILQAKWPARSQRKTPGVNGLRISGSIRARNSHQHHLVTDVVEETKRPHVLDRFADLLKAATSNPMMLAYVQRLDSHCPECPLGLRWAKNRGWF